MTGLGYTLIPGLIVGLSLGLLPVVAEVASAQDTDIDAENCSVAIFCQSSDHESRGGNAHGGNGGNGGFASVHDIANAYADASSSVIAGDITSADADVLADPAFTIVGSFPDMGEDIVVQGGGSVQRGATGGNGSGADEAGGDGSDATGGKGGNHHTDQSRLVILP